MEKTNLGIDVCTRMKGLCGRDFYLYFTAKFLSPGHVRS